MKEKLSYYWRWLRLQLFYYFLTIAGCVIFVVATCIIILVTPIDIVKGRFHIKAVTALIGLLWLIFVRLPFGVLVGAISFDEAVDLVAGMRAEFMNSIDND